jgi:hypothetical protein
MMIENKYNIFNKLKYIQTIIFTVNVKWFYEGIKFYSN